jgi:hypothetical protein
MSKKPVEIIHHVFNQAWPQYMQYQNGIAIMATHVEGNSFVDLTTVICSSADQYSKKVATRMLRQNFIDGKTIRLPIGIRRGVDHAVLRHFVVEFANTIME